MGFEIKNICTVVPNPYHPSYDPKNEKAYDGGKYYYFSLFITPRLQFDGTLKEFYEMLHWPEYAEKIFWKFKQDAEGIILDELDSSIEANLKTCFLSSPGKINIDLKKDYELLRPVLKGMEIIDDLHQTIEPSDISAFLNKAKKTWKKLFHENVPVEAWPIYLKPQVNSVNEEKIRQLRRSIAEAKRDLKDLTSSQSGLPNGPLVSGEVHNDHATAEISQRTQLSEKIRKDQRSLDDLKKKSVQEKHNITKYRQEFHKKISALARYPHILRVLGLIQDFKIEKSQLNSIKIPNFLLRMEFETSIRATNSENYPFDEFSKSVQFVRPYTRCEKTQEHRLRSYFIHPTGPEVDQIVNDGEKVPDYNQYVCNGFLNTLFFDEEEKEVKVFTVDQEYYEDKSADFKNSEEDKDPNIVGINKKVFSDEEIAVLKQKVAIKPKISKGFSIKVHGQPAGILVNMDQQFQKITDDNIELPESAFMAHHLDCGYRVDVAVGKGDELEWKSLCQREAKYVVDRKDDDWKIPFIGKPITLYRDSNTLFSNLKDEPWLEEVRQIDEDGKANRFEEISRWNGWSVTCPPLYNNCSAPNKEADDMELQEIKPPKGSLPKLRFGTEYSFRIRTVDICGNGPELNDKPDDQCIFIYKPIETEYTGYQRLELINPPMFFAPYELIPGLATATDDEIENKKKKNEGFKINGQYKGEDNETLVVRTKVDASGKAYLEVIQECVRFLTPPPVTTNFAEISGQFDGIKASKLYSILKNVPKTFYEESEIEDEIPFPIDNLVSGIVVTYPIDKSSPKQVVSVTCRLSKKLGELTKKPLKIILNETGLQVGLENIPVLKGEAKLMQVLSIHENGKMNVPKKSTEKNLRVIHAVQRPYLKSLETIFTDKKISISQYFQFKKVTPSPKSYKPEQKYQVEIVISKETDPDRPADWGSEWFPFSTAGELVLHAEYCDYELNPENPEGWSYISKSHPKNKGGKAQTGIGKGQEKDADKFLITKSWSNLDETSEEDKFDTLINNLVDPNDFAPNSTSNKIQDNFNFFTHSFPDTKFRKVKYSIEAISKFSEFFDIKEHKIDKTDATPFSVFATLNPESDGTTIINNSAKPSKPNITSIVPVFTIPKPEKTNNGTVYKFVHQTFRIYLGNNWYETGLDEKIAVTYEAINPTKETSFRDKISVIANDPTTPKSSLYNDTTKNYIDSARVNNNFDDSLNLEIISTNIDSLKPGDPPVSIRTAQDYKKEFGFSTFDVHWDTIKGEFYADIEVSQGKLDHYSTLLKFGVCRYQKHSIIQPGFYDYRFSDVVMTDMVSILPKRTIRKENNYYFVEGKPGGRYIVQNKNKVFSTNILYQIGETYKNKSENISLLKDRDVNNKILIKRINLNSDKVFKNLNYQEHFIEEYENIPLDDVFTMNDRIKSDGTLEDEYYNPRNDPRKRLVFFYKFE
ncbi:hypothetical protein BH10BAC3_BH10BAC3_12060 [soil metagenome]